MPMRKRGKNTEVPSPPPPSGPLNKKTVAKNPTNESPRKYKPVLVNKAYIEVPPISRAEKRKYVGGGDSDHERTSRARPSVKPQKHASQRPPSPPLDVEGDGEESSEGAESVQGDSIAARTRARRNALPAPNRCAPPPPVRQTESEGPPEEDKAPASPTPKPKKKKSKGKKKAPSPQPAISSDDEGRAPESATPSKKRRLRTARKAKALQSAQTSDSNCEENSNGELRSQPVRENHATGRDAGDVFVGSRVSDENAVSYTLPPLSSDPFQGAPPEGQSTPAPVSPPPRSRAHFEQLAKKHHFPTTMLNIQFAIPPKVPILSTPT
ncbi:hypothetical protein NMY22_g4755 [Coprinellus aureogranulatus]|nr:hypothetical protein NMY22_g4755 [Coprinellus aureogranulatus]